MPVLLVAGLSLKNVRPRVWDAASPYYLSALNAVMVSYADLDQLPKRRRDIMELGLRAVLGVPESVKVYLDNGAFYFLRRSGDRVVAEYEEFVAQAPPDWYPIPQDYIPSPKMTLDEQRQCLTLTMGVNQRYHHDGFVPVIHISRMIDEYVEAVRADERLAAKPAIGLGGIVPNLLRMPKARPYQEVLDSVRRVRAAFADKHIHLFGVGGTATLHLAALLGMDSVDSSGWRNRAARGLVQLPGRGDRFIADLGNWRGRKPSDAEWAMLDACPCPACRQFGRDGLLANGTAGFSNRATHNLWTLLEEARLIDEHLKAETYRQWYQTHLDNTVYLPLIQKLVEAGAADPVASESGPHLEDKSA
jgi:7-cyano-7-deazaguanine tRNA-ribosyltransferase